MPSEHLSHRLVAFREKHGLLQADLAGVLGITPRYLGYLETGQKEVDVNSSLYKYFEAIEQGHVSMDRQLGRPSKGGSQVKEDPFDYVGAVESRGPRRGDAAIGGLSSQDVLSQIRADIAMIEGGAQAEKRRAYHFLAQVHLPMLAKMLKLE